MSSIQIGLARVSLFKTSSRSVDKLVSLKLAKNFHLMDGSSKGSKFSKNNIVTKLPEVILRNHPRAFPSHPRRMSLVTGEKSKLFPLMESKELKIPVPYGHIAAQEWGDPNGIPTLAGLYAITYSTRVVLLFRVM